MDVNGNYIILGDTNCDQRITIEDAMMITLHISGITTLTGDAFTAGDINGDNKITKADRDRLMEHLKGAHMLAEVESK